MNLRKPEHIMALMDLNKHEFDEAVVHSKILSFTEKQLRWQTFLASQQPLMDELKASRKQEADEAVRADVLAYIEESKRPLKGIRGVA